MGQKIVTINPTANTTPQDAVEMAYEFARSLRMTGWTTADGDFARSLWVQREFGKSPLLPYLLAGFNAGYMEGVKPLASELTRLHPFSKSKSAKPRIRH